MEDDNVILTMSNLNLNEDNRTCQNINLHLPRSGKSFTFNIATIEKKNQGNKRQYTHLHTGETDVFRMNKLI